MEGADSIKNAFERYDQAVKSGEFPSADYSFAG
jgi:ketopantoate hydroxymethyltransferase